MTLIEQIFADLLDKKICENLWKSVVKKIRTTDYADSHRLNLKEKIRGEKNMSRRLRRFSLILSRKKICGNLWKSVVKKIRTTDYADSHRLKLKEKIRVKKNMHHRLRRFTQIKT